MHHSRLCAVLIDCKTSDVDEAARFWGEVLGRPVDPGHPGSRGSYRMLETPPDEPIVQIQRVDHESRVHIDIETDDIPAEVDAPREIRRQGHGLPGVLGGDAGADRPTLLCRTGTESRLPEERQPLGLEIALRLADLSARKSSTRAQGSSRSAGHNRTGWGECVVEKTAGDCRRCRSRGEIDRFPAMTPLGH